MIPLWAILAFAAALGATAIPLIQERFKADGFALAFWNKVVDCVLLLPLMVYFGVPHDGMFYLYTALTAVMYAVCDVLYFRAIPVIGSGLMTRLLPSSVLFTFLTWFIVKPQQVNDYLAQPAKAAALAGIFALFLGSAFCIKRCAVSWAGVRLVWPVIAIASVGPLLSKLALDRAAPAAAVGGFIASLQAPVTYLFFQAGMMLVCMGSYYKIKRPVTRAVMRDPQNIRTACLMGLVMTVILILRMKALELVDNPGLVSLIFFTDALWVILVYKLAGRREDGNIWAGLGIVASAALLVIIKSLP